MESSTIKEIKIVIRQHGCILCRRDDSMIPIYEVKGYKLLISNSGSLDKSCFGNPTLPKKIKFGNYDNSNIISELQKNFKNGIVLTNPVSVTYFMEKAYQPYVWNRPKEDGSDETLEGGVKILYLAGFNKEEEKEVYEYIKSISNQYFWRTQLFETLRSEFGVNEITIFDATCNDILITSYDNPTVIESRPDGYIIKNMDTVKDLFENKMMQGGNKKSKSSKSRKFRKSRKSRKYKKKKISKRKTKHKKRE